MGVTPTNDPDDLRDDDELYRRFLPVKKNVVPLSAFTRPRTSDPDPAISVDLARETTPEKALEAGMPTHFKLGILRVGAVRSLGFTVRRDPMPDNPAHCIIEGVRTADDCDRLAEQATVYTPPAQ